MNAVAPAPSHEMVETPPLIMSGSFCFEVSEAKEYFAAVCMSSSIKKELISSAATNTIFIQKYG